jgi:hypothetical protein
MFGRISDQLEWKRRLVLVAQHSRLEIQNSQKIMKGMSMNPVNLRMLLCATCFLALHLGIARAQRAEKAAANPTCAGVINTRPVSTISIDEVSKFGDAVIIQNDFGGLTFRPFDDDDRPRRGKEIEIGLILARSGDLGGTPVGLIVWSDRNLDFSFRKTPEGAISVESNDLKSCKVLATFEFNGKGYVLRDGKAIAQAH